jgi:hypothetical protein
MVVVEQPFCAGSKNLVIAGGLFERTVRIFELAAVLRKAFIKKAAAPPDYFCLMLLGELARIIKECIAR